MKILLINPPWVSRKGNIWNDIASVMPPLGLAWIAAVLERNGHYVRILDAHAQRKDFDDILSYIRTHDKRFDIAALTATTSLIKNAAAISKAVKSEFPEMRTVVGGVHATVLPEEVISYEGVDIVVRGEGEITMLEIARGRDLSMIDGITYKKDSKIIHNRDRELIKDLDWLGMPAYHLLPMDKYYPAVGAYRNLPAISVLATRGCPGRCTFCYRLFGPKLRVRSGVRIAEEVKYLQDNYGIKEISFYDDTFTAVKKEVFAFCKRLEELNVKITWSCFSRVDSIDEELLITMKRTGLHQIMYGIESASHEILRNINKRADTEKAENVIEMTKKTGIDVRAAFMLGNPGETAKTMEQTLRFAMRLNPEIAVFNITTPFPGTEMYEWADKNGYILTKDWDRYDLAHPVMNLPTVSNEEIQKFYKKVYKKFYLRPAYIFMRLSKLRDMKKIAEAFKGLKAVFRV